MNNKISFAFITALVFTFSLQAGEKKPDDIDCECWESIRKSINETARLGVLYNNYTDFEKCARLCPRFADYHVDLLYQAEGLERPDVPKRFKTHNNARTLFGSLLEKEQDQQKSPAQDAQNDKP